MDKIVFVGDIMLGRSIADTIEKRGVNQILAGVKDVITDDCLVVANLEAPFTKNTPYYKGKKGNLSFGVKPTTSHLLDALKIGVVSLANNHMTDCGYEGIETTKQVLQESKIGFCGAGIDKDSAYSLAERTVSGKKIGIMSVCAFGQYTKYASDRNWGIAAFNINNILKYLKKESSRFDLVVLSVHWGVDYYPFPVKRYLDAVKRIIDEIHNLKIVVGHHPHLIQPILSYKDAIVACSLGNFLFDEPFPLSRIGMMLYVNISQTLRIKYDVCYTLLDFQDKLRILSKDDSLMEIARIDAVLEKMEKDDKEYLAMSYLTAVKELQHLVQDFSIEKLQSLLGVFGVIGLVRAVLIKMKDKCL